MGTLEERQAALSFVKLMHETLKDPNLLAEAEKAHAIIEQCHNAQDELSKMQELARHETNKNRAEHATSAKSLQDKEDELVSRSGKLDKRETDIGKREREIEQRNRESKSREITVADREQVHGNNVRAIQEREKRVQDKESQLAEREKAVQIREDYFKNMPR